MGLLTHEERSELIILLLKLPNMSNRLMRSQLYARFPSKLQARIVDEGIPRTHIANIVDTLDDESWVEPYGGSWPILKLIENAISMVGQESPIGHQLDYMLTNLTMRAKQPLAEPSNLSAPNLASKDLQNVSDKDLLEAYLNEIQEMEQSLEFTDRRNYSRSYIHNIIQRLKQFSKNIYLLQNRANISHASLYSLYSLSNYLQRAEEELNAALYSLEARDKTIEDSYSFYEHLSNSRYSLGSASDSLAKFVAQL